MPPPGVQGGVRLGKRTGLVPTKVSLETPNRVRAPGTCAMGIDAGSAFVSVAVLDPSGELVAHDYRRHEGNVVGTVQEVLAGLDVRTIAYAGKTGSGAEQLSSTGPYVDPIVAALIGAKAVCPEVRNIITIGAGSYTLLMLNKDGEYLRHTTNSACASGTGAFLDQQAIRLGSLPENLCDMAGCSGSCPGVATRCAVFAKTDIIHLQQSGYSPEDIAAGICKGMAESTLDVLLQGKSISGPTLLAGGVAQNAEVVRHISDRLGFSVQVPPLPQILGARGAALRAREEEARVPKNWVVTSARRGREERLRRPSLALEKSTYPDFEFFHAYTDGHGTEVALVRKPEMKRYEVVIGIDIGSTSTKCVACTDDGEPLVSCYRKTAGDPVKATQLIFEALRAEATRAGIELDVVGVGTTGSGRKLTGRVIGADLEINEITAHARAAVEIDPGIDTILEIGGQDAKFTQIEDGIVTHAVMNHVCAAGTGSFIEEQAKRLAIPLDGYGDRVLGVAPPRTSDRCTVFMERDLGVLLADGWSQDEVAAAVLYSVCENYLNKVVAGRPIGERVYFQGATARNKALVAAFELTLGKSIAVSKFCHLTGALGTALLLLDRKATGEQFRGLSFADARVSSHHETCELCRNTCSLTVIDVEEEQVGWGMKCGREYTDRVRARKPSACGELLRKRRRLLLGGGGRNPKNPRFTVGFPMSLTAHGYLPLWTTLLRRLGGKVAFSRGGSDEAVKRGSAFTQAEFCAPVTASHGHVAELAASGSDFIFLPQMIRAPRDEKYTDSHFCAFVQSHASVLSATGILGPDSPPLISPEINFTRGSEVMARSIHKALAPVVKVSLREVRRALAAGLEAQEEFRRKLQEAGSKVVERLAAAGEMGIVILGRPYTVNDPGLSVGLAEKIAEMGVTVIPLDCFPVDLQGEEDPRWDNMYWHYGQRILEAARTLVKQDNLFGIMFSNFCCGPDAYLISYFKEIMAERGKPFLALEFDAHGADAGYVTRVEAALESFRAWRKKPGRGRGPVRTDTPEIDGNRTIFFPPMDWITAELFANVFRGEGYKSEVLPENEQTLDVGYRHTKGGECVPCPSTLGSLISVMEERNLDPSEVALFLTTSSGPCRFGQYGCLDRLVFAKKGWDDIQIISPAMENGYMGIPLAVRKTLLRTLMVADILWKLLLKVRPYETTPGTADAALQESMVAIGTMLRDGGARLGDAVADATDRFCRVPRAGGGRPRVGIVGEIYVRNDIFINQDVARAIESYGGEVMRPSMTEWFLYSNCLHRDRLRENRGGIIPRVSAWLERRFCDASERELYGRAADLVHDRREPAIEQVISAGRQHVADGFEGEAVLTVGRALHFIEKEGAAAVVNLSPSFCMPGTVTTSIFGKIEAETGVPIICLFYDGSGEPNKILRPHLDCLTRKVSGATGPT